MVTSRTSPALRRIHVVFKTHLDLGFTDHAAVVARRYREDFIPAAIALARDLRRAGGEDRFIWTTGSWLIHHALTKGTPTQRRNLLAAIRSGDLAWHGLPCTTHTELMDAELFRFGLGFARKFDERFGRRTVAAKMTDVPGHTRAMVPLMAETGLTFLHLGVNPACPAPETPAVFRWMDLATRREIIVAYQAGSYGDLTTVPGGEEALYFAHTADNHGPPTAAHIRETFTALRARFPDALVGASTMDAFARALEPLREQLPVITAEIGDTWIHGVGSDPAKTARFRALLDWRRRLPRPNAPALAAFNENLLLTAEHTWGLDIKTSFGFLDAHEQGMATSAFRRRRHLPRYRRLEASWREQRAYLQTALDALPTSALKKAAQSALRPLAARPFRAGAPLAAGQPMHGRHLTLVVDPATGALRSLRQASDGREWIGRQRPFALLSYEIFSWDDYRWMWKHYNRNHRETESWSVPDFLKLGLKGVVDKHRSWSARLHRFSRLKVSRADAFVAEGDFGLDAGERRRFGAPARWQIRYTLPHDRPALELEVQWFDKPAVRLPEALWLALVPRWSADARWSLHKLGSVIDPTDVLRHGNRRLHATDGVRYVDTRGSFFIANPDAPLVAPSGPALVRYESSPPDPSRGCWFNLYNNTWNTNFPLWYQDNARFRFTLTFSSGSDGSSS